MSRFVSERIKRLPTGGGLYEIFQKALDLEKQGHNIIHMEIGRPDFDSPVKAKEAAIKALNEGFVHYTPMSGIDELKKAIIDKYKKDRNMDIDINNELTVAAGACEALLAVMMSVLNEDDEILIPSPYFTGYTDEVLLSGAKLVEIPLRMENRFLIDPEDIKKAITEKTKAILINSPHNPTGAVFDRSILEKIAEIAIKYDLLVISDECYDAFVFEGNHVSIADIDNMRERTVIINSASKVFSMTGWRVGYAIGPKDIINNINTIHKNMSTCATSFAQVGAAEAFRSGESFTLNMVEEFKKRRDLVVKYLDEIEELEYVEPSGAFYVFISIKNLNMSSSKFCKYILDEAGVALVPGDAFGEYGKGFIRLAYSCSYSDIEQAMIKIKEAVKKLHK